MLEGRGSQALFYLGSSVIWTEETIQEQRPWRTWNRVERKYDLKVLIDIQELLQLQDKVD